MAKIERRFAKTALGHEQKAYRYFSEEGSKVQPAMKLQVFDPRDKHQNLDDPETWKPTDNPALISAWYAVSHARESGLTLVDDFWKSVGERAWKSVGERADFCDELVPFETTKPPDFSEG